MKNQHQAKHEIQTLVCNRNGRAIKTFSNKYEARSFLLANQKSGWYIQLPSRVEEATAVYDTVTNIVINAWPSGMSKFAFKECQFLNDNSKRLANGVHRYVVKSFYAH